MNNINNEAVVNYINNLYVANHKSEFIEKLRSEAERDSIPIIHRDIQEFIKTILAIYKPKNILEIGTAIGYSSIFFARYTDDDCRITSIEKNKKMYERAVLNIEKFGYNNKVELVLADAVDFLETLDQDNFDLVFIDAAKGQYPKFFELIYPLLCERSIILSDNILYKGMIADDKLVIRRKKTIVKRIRKYLDNLLSMDNIYTSILAIGDGLAISYKEDR